MDVAGGARDFTFDLEGELLDRADFATEIICGRPVVAGNGEFISSMSSGILPR